MNTTRLSFAPAILGIAWALLLALILLTHVGVGLGSVAPTVALLLAGLALFFLIGAMAAPKRDIRIETPAVDLRPAPQVQIDDVLDVRRERREGDVIIFDGRVRTEPDAAYDTLSRRFKGTEWTPLIQEGESHEQRVMLIPAPSDRSTLAVRGPGINILLAALTLVTTTWAGALHQGVNLVAQPGRFAEGLPYSLALMLILGAHELGHSVTARRHGMTVTWPYFIPIPFALGTFGAFIQLKSPSPSRRALFDVGVAGPLAGLVFAVPALLIGLPLSHVTAATTALDPALHSGADVGSSILLTVLAKLSLGPALAEGHVLVLHPLAFAGWLGLIVTALNLLPIGQLDGGHMADAMFGQRIGASIGTVAMVALFALGVFVWSGLLFWAFIVFFIAGRKGLPPLNDLSGLDRSRFAIGTASFALLAAILVPVPHALFSSLGIQCPYL